MDIFPVMIRMWEVTMETATAISMVLLVVCAFRYVRVFKKFFEEKD